MENLTFADNEYDIVVVHSGLHHCRSPHRALLEMYRVAKHEVSVFENRDNGLIKLAAQFGFNADYEIEAVVGNNY